MENTTLQIIKDDPYLEPFQDTYTNLHKKMNEMILQFEF